MNSTYPQLILHGLRLLKKCQNVSKEHAFQACWLEGFIKTEKEKINQQNSVQGSLQ